MGQSSTLSNANHFLPKLLLYWLPLAFSISVLTAFVYGAVQQSYRQTANDPQIQMAEDAAIQLEAGQTPLALKDAARVDISRSLAPFLIVYDDAGQPITSTAQLNGHTPSIPAGVFSYVRQSGEDRLTWQPQEGVRIAAVVTQFGGGRPGFVLAGRSLREQEDRVDRLTLMAGLAWAAALVGSLTILAFVLWSRNRPARR